jgi:hypothetical protein
MPFIQHIGGIGMGMGTVVMEPLTPIVGLYQDPVINPQSDPHYIPVPASTSTEVNTADTVNGVPMNTAAAGGTATSGSVLGGMSTQTMLLIGAGVIAAVMLSKQQ